MNFLAIKKDQTKFDIVLWILIFSVVFVVHEPRILKFFFLRWFIFPCRYTVSRIDNRPCECEFSHRRTGISLSTPYR